LLHGAFVYEPKLRPSALCPALMFDGQWRCSVAWQDEERLVAWCKAARVRWCIRGHVGLISWFYRRWRGEPRRLQWAVEGNQWRKQTILTPRATY
jgi:hypothetical protein